jgi:hypothetical protein
MAHPQQVTFCKSVKEKFPQFFKYVDVCDIGSLDINGNNRYLFDKYTYIGVDVGEGKNVDVISKGHEFTHSVLFDVVISTECFEHDMYWEKTLDNVVNNLLAPGGLFLFSCATTGRPEHGTRRTTPENSPLTAEQGEWSDYYKNLTEEDVKGSLDMSLFSQYEFSIGHETKDLYFWGIKK